jgi:peroxiredoxin
MLGISADNPFAQKTFADSLKLPYPLLSDFPDLKVVRRLMDSLLGEPIAR